MQTQTRKVRITLTALGLWTIVAGFIDIFVATTQLRGWRGDPLSDASIVALLLGVLLAVGGASLVVRGMKYQSRASHTGRWSGD